MPELCLKIDMFTFCENEHLAIYRNLSGAGCSHHRPSLVTCSIAPFILCYHNSNVIECLLCVHKVGVSDFSNPRLQN